MRCLVIGYGNTLRSDDAAGQQIAETVAEWGLEQVEAIAVHQLTPELAEPISIAQLVIFVDVYVASDGNTEVQLIELTGLMAPETAIGVGHTADPRSLLNLAQQIYGRSPQSWWILVPAVDFEFGEQLSLVTQQGVGVAIDRIKGLLQDL